MDSNFFLCDLKSCCIAAATLEGLEMSMKDQFTFATAPIQSQGQDIFRKFAEMFADGTPCPIDDFVQAPKSYATNFDELSELEKMHHDIILYLWLR
jgi:hypothetical protein